MLPTWSPPRPPAQAAPTLDTVATPAAPQSFTLGDLVLGINELRREVADALWRVAPGSPAVSNSLALVTAWLVKVGPGVVYGIDGFNASGSTRDIQFLDWRDTAIPPDGAIPFWFKEVATVTNFNQDWGIRGLRFEQGLWVVSSSTRATKTITSAADIFVTVRYL